MCDNIVTDYTGDEAPHANVIEPLKARSQTICKIMADLECNIVTSVNNETILNAFAISTESHPKTTKDMIEKQVMSLRFFQGALLYH